MAKSKYHKSKYQRIDLQQSYPCPCHRKGCLVPIALTEALGCDRCQEIFVVDESGYKIEQVAVHYLYKPIWQWTGDHWIRLNAGPKVNIPLLFLALIIPILIWLPLVLHSTGPIILWAIISFCLAILPAFIVWLSYRR